jgi:hypothetical protein
LGTQRGEIIRVAVGDQPRIDASHPVGDLARAGEGNLHRYLLIEKHAGKQGKRVLSEYLIGVGITG